MKNILLGIVLGMVLHKSLNYAYDYSFEKAFLSSTCSAVMDVPGKNLTDRIDCVYAEMGTIENLKYLLMRPSARTIFNKESWIF